METNIWFHCEEVNYRIRHKKAIRNWLIATANKEGSQVGALNFIYCSDSYLLEMNQQYLDHDTFTDVITFDYTDQGVVSGDIFISLDRIIENAKSNKVSLQKELHRVMVHGLLHLLGYKDKTKAQKNTMRSKEDYYLSLQTF